MNLLIAGISKKLYLQQALKKCKIMLYLSKITF